jgi:hypothetical protein
MFDLLKKHGFPKPLTRGSIRFTKALLTFIEKFIKGYLIDSSSFMTKMYIMLDERVGFKTHVSIMEFIFQLLLNLLNQWSNVKIIEGINNNKNNSMGKRAMMSDIIEEEDNDGVLTHVLKVLEECVRGSLSLTLLLQVNLVCSI